MARPSSIPPAVRASIEQAWHRPGSAAEVGRAHGLSEVSVTAIWAQAKAKGRLPAARRLRRLSYNPLAENPAERIGRRPRPVHYGDVGEPIADHRSIRIPDHDPLLAAFLKGAR